MKVFVHDTEQGFLRWNAGVRANHRTIYGGKGRRPILVATCTHVEERYKGRRTPVVAWLQFHRGRVGVSTIVHEAFHATICAGRRLKVGVINPATRLSATTAEESLAELQGELVRKISNRFFQLGIWTKAA